MKKIVLIIICALMVLGGLAWINKVPLILAMASFQTDKRYADLEPNREVTWDASKANPGTPSPSQDQPNIILIVADDLGFNDISTFGGGVAGGRVKTPNIDRLAAEGAVFEQSYSGHNTCAPSRGMLMTGRYPSKTGFSFTPTPEGMIKIVSTVSSSLRRDLPRAAIDTEAEKSKPPYEQMGLPGSETTIAELLSQRGYYTAHIGKWHLGRSNGMAPQDQGFDDSLLMASGLYLPEDSPDVVNAKLDFDPIDKFLWAGVRYAASFNDPMSIGFEPGGYLTDYYTDESLKVIEASKDQPFFLYLAHWGVHTPLQATREDYEAVGDIKPHRLRVYAAMIRALDRSVGRVMEKLEQEGLAENTVVMFTSDNGGAGYLGLPGVNSPYRGWKITSFEGGLRVPIFLKWPNKVPAGLKIKQPAMHIDLLPTIAAATETALPAELSLDGENLLALTDPLTADQWDRETLFWVSDHAQVVRHGDWKLQLNNRKATDGLQKWLFDLKNDPTEQHNLAASRPDKLAQLEALLKEHVANSRPPLWPPATQLAVMIDKDLSEKYVNGDEYVFSPN
ncbi:MAG: sulfatase-like hydrolase/transferase [Pseudomonadota bacterium]